MIDYRRTVCIKSKWIRIFPPRFAFSSGLLFLVRAVVALIVIPKGTGIMDAFGIYYGDLTGLMVEKRISCL